MADIFDNEKRSEIMRKVKSKKNKSTELRLIEVFKKNGITGWKRNYPVKGHPDFLVLKLKVAFIVPRFFLDWHVFRNKSTANNQEYWKNKRERNMKHDREVTAMFENRGWTVLRIWECELKKKNEADLMQRLSASLSSKRTLVSKEES